MLIRAERVTSVVPEVLAAGRRSKASSGGGFEPKKRPYGQGIFLARVCVRGYGSPYTPCQKAVQRGQHQLAGPQTSGRSRSSQAGRKRPTARPRLVALAFSERYPCGSMSLHPPGFIEPCLPTGSRTAPTGPQWAYEIKHDGFRFICHRDGERVRVFSRTGHEWGAHLPTIDAAPASAAGPRSNPRRRGSDLRTGRCLRFRPHARCV